MEEDGGMSNPSGLCECGCGQMTPLAKQTRRERGQVRGEPLRFINGHNRTGRKVPPWEERFERVDAGYETPCRVWQGYLMRNGYGATTARAGRSGLVHRVEWERVNGPIPEGLTIDHLCRNRACAEVAHLELVTPAENARRGREAARSTGVRRCGHPWTSENSYRNGADGTTRCRECHRRAERIRATA